MFASKNSSFTQETLFFSQEVLTGVSLFRDSLRRVVVPEETFPFSEEEV